MIKSQWSERVRKRDGHRCVLCGSQRIRSHHILPKEEYPSLRFQISNGVTLCYLHHTAVHRLMITSKQYFLLAPRGFSRSFVSFLRHHLPVWAVARSTVKRQKERRLPTYNFGRKKFTVNQELRG